MYEYRVTEITGEHSYDSERISAQINTIAQAGWRLVHTIQEDGYTSKLIFERPIDNIGADKVAVWERL